MNANFLLRLPGSVFSGWTPRVIPAPLPCQLRLPRIVTQVAFLPGFCCFVSFSGCCRPLQSPRLIAALYLQVRTSCWLVASLRSTVFAVFANGPCVLTVAPPRLFLPGRVYPVFQSVVSLIRPPLRRFAVTVSSDFVASFRDPGFFPVFRDGSASRACGVFLVAFFLSPASGCCRSGVFLSRFFQTSPGFVALLRRGDSFFVAVCNRSVPLSHRVFPVSLPRSRRPRFRFFVLSSRFCCSCVIVVNRRFSFFAGSPVGCFLPAVLLRWFSRFFAPSRFPDCVTPLVCLPFAQAPLAGDVSTILHSRLLLSCVFPVMLPRRASLFALLRGSGFPEVPRFSLAGSASPVFAASCFCYINCFVSCLLSYVDPLRRPGCCSAVFFSRVFRFCCAVAFFRLRRPVVSVRPLSPFFRLRM